MADILTSATPALRNLGVFLTWTITSFLCHWCAKAFLTSVKVETKPDPDVQSSALQFRLNLWGASIVTIVQMVLCYLCVGMKNTKARQYLTTARITHVIATLATNISMAMMFASSTFAIKLMEPITSAVTQYCLLGTPLTSGAMLSLPVIVGGAIAFSGNPLTDTSLSIGVGAAFASNIILAVRNLAIKKMGDGDKPAMTMKVKLSQMPLVCSWIIGISFMLLYLEKTGLLPPGSPGVIVKCFLSGVFHVAYSYVSTGMVLTQLSVVSHAVANIMKRVLVVLLLYLCGSRSAGVGNFLGLFVCVAGLLMYAWDKRPRQPSSAASKTSTPGSGGSTLSFHTRRMLYAAFGLFALCSVFFSATLTRGARSVSVEGLSHTAARSLPWVSGNKARRVLMESQTPTFMETLPDLSFGPRSFERPSWKELEPDLSGYLVNDSLQIASFLQQDLAERSEQSNYLSNKLRTHIEIIKETQRIHYKIFDEILGRYKYCMLIDTADFENKGDPAITAGEIYYLARVGIEIIYYCNTQTCSEANLARAATVARKYSPDELVIMVHGGGNINHYTAHDYFRFSVMKKFSGFQIFSFPQSIRVENYRTPHFEKCRQAYCCNENFTMVLRDLGSMAIAKQHFNGSSRLIMAPDMAFHIGPVKRFISPVFDIMWIRRNDTETPGYRNLPKPPPGIRMHVSDWHSFLTPRAGSSLEKSFYAQVMGFFFLQRGRVIITDRVHGHILATLMDIPHVLLDNQHKKLSNYLRTWNNGLRNVRLTDTPVEALKLALELLETYKDTLPPRLPFLDVSPTFRKVDYSYAETWYP